MDLDSVADELYGLAPEEFTPTRNARAKAAKAAGDVALSREIQALAKPNAVAWLANRLVRDFPQEVEPLLDLGEGLREAAATLTGEQLRELTQQRHRLVAALVQQARAIEGAAARRVSDETARGLEMTLQAALADPEAAEALRAGRLVAGLEPSGFGPVGGSRGPVRDIRTAPSATVQASRTAGTEAAEQRLRDELGAVEQTLQAAEAEAAEAAETRVSAQREADRAERAATKAAEQVARLAAELDEATAASTEAADAARRAATALARAERLAAAAERRTAEVRRRRDALTARLSP